MMSSLPVRALLALSMGLLAHARPAGAQRPWNDAASRELVERATLRRAQQLADSGLVDYSAQAHGYLTFLGQVGEGFALPPKVIKADELVLEVYWRAPNSSKQWIVGRRDTLLLPTDINYHRDHLGIVQNNFPEIIRLGDGDEVQDVAHPLSARGLATYEYQLSDSLRLGIPGRVIDVYEVKVRPRDDREAAAVGAMYLAKDDAQVVRMAFSFTRSALKDRQLEDVSVVLENSLIEGRFWLPRRQEIEIRRTGSWMDFPARGIIRGRWEIRDYRVNQGAIVALTPGPEIVYAPAERRARHRWPEQPIMAGIPDDVQLATERELRRVQDEARRLVRAQALQRARGTVPSARALSDLARVNRAEGLALGAGLRRHLGAGFDAVAVGRMGTADHEAKATLSLGWERASGAGIRARAFREYRDAGDEAETSRSRNSIAAQEFGSDYSQPFDTRGAALGVHLGTHAGLTWRLDGGYEWHDAVSVAARPAQGRYAPTLPASRLRGTRFSLAVERPPGTWWGGGRLRSHGELRLGSMELRDSPGGDASNDDRDAGAFVRGFAVAEWSRELGRAQLHLRVAGGAVGAQGDVPPQLLLFAGGPLTAPGYGFHQFRSRAMGSARAEWRTPVPFVPIPLGRWGQIPGEARLAPFVNLVATRSLEAGAFGTASPSATPAIGRDVSAGGVYPSLGVGVFTLFDLIRVDVARGLRNGRWTLAIDVSRDFWSIL